jgi:hypothetical protein
MIDKEKQIENIAIDLNNIVCFKDNGLVARYATAEAMYNTDYRKVVLCKDCIHSKHWYADKRLCSLWAENYVTVFDDGYCSYGEREVTNNDGE